MEIVIKIDNKRYKDILRISTVQLKGRTPTLEQIIAKGTPLPKGHSFIAICENDYPLSEEVIDDLKNTLFVGDTDVAEDITYCFTIKEIIEGSDSE